MNNNFLSRLVMLLGAIVLTCNVAWGETIELGQTNVAGISTYSANEQTFTQSNVTFGFVNAKNNSSNGTPSGWAKSQVIQMQENGLLYNKTALGIISNIRVYLVANTNTFSVTSGTSEKPTTNKVSRPTTSTGTENVIYTSYSNKTTTEGQSTTANYYDFDLSEKGATYFQIACGSQTIYIYKIVITYEAATPPTKRIYLSLFDKWKEADAKTGIYDATNGEWMTTFAVEGTGSEIGYYYDDIPTSCNKITIGRFSPSTDKPFGWSGDNFWGQSVDFDITNNNLIKLQGWGTEGEAKGKAYGDLSNLYTIGEATYTNCSLTSGTWPTCAQESGTEFDLAISAEEGYKLNNGVTASGCTAQWSPVLTQDATSGTLHVTITGDSASIEVSAISDEYTVTWMANGVEHDTKTDYSYNNVLVMPATNPQPCDRNHFIGWTATQNYSSSSTRPLDLFTEAGDKKVTTDITYYAVYAQLSKNSEETFTSKLAYSGETTKMTGNNDAALLGLDEYRWSVVGAKNNGSGLPGLNTSGYIALYGNSAGGNTITVTSLTGVTIPNIKVYVKTGKDYNDNYVIKVNDVPISATDGSFPINATSFVIGNANEDNTQVRIDSIVINNNITYTSYSTTCAVPTWTMSFDNQGHGAQVSPKEVAHNTATTAPSAPAAIGWAFGGWYKEATCENVWDFTNDVVTRDITLYAKWTIGWTFLCSVDNYASHIINSDLTYTVQLEANTTYWFRYTDGVSIKYGLSTDGNIMTKDSHTDWKIYQNNAYDCGIATTAAGEYTFHATEEGAQSTTLNITVDYPASVAVTFDLNGHGDDIIRYTTPGEALATLPATPTTTGYDFAGWFTDQECTTPWTSTEAISENKTVYAKWTVARTTLYLNAGGSELWDKDNAKFAVYYFNSETDNGWSEFMTNYDDCDAIYRTTIPQGYEYVNFVRLKNTCETPNWTDKWNQTSNKSIDGTWNRCTITAFEANNTDCPANYDSYDPTVVVTFHYNGYTTDCDEQISGPKCSTITLPDGKVVAGKTFNGWLAQGSKTPLAAGSTYTMPANNVTLTASYTNWTISYNYNGTIVSGVEVPETGVVLPTTVPDGAQGADNNIFIGFTKTQNYSATDLPNDFIPAGSVYTPAAGGEILYALYRQGDAEYKLIKDTKDLRLGAHVVLASIDEDYAMGKNFVEGQDTLPAIVVTKDGDYETITFGKDVQEWTLTTNGNNVGSWSFRRASDNKYLASSNTVGKVTLGTNVTTGSSFRIAIDASGRAMVQCVANYNISTLSMGDNGAFGCYNPNTIDAPDLAIYQHIGTKYVTTPSAVYRVKSVDMVNGRLDKNDYYAEGTSIDLNGYANEGYSTSNVYRVYNEATHDTISKTKIFTMPAYNVVDTLTNRALLDTLKFVVPECVTPTPSNIRANGNTEVNLPNEVANVNSWNFVGWTKTAINDTSEVHSEIFTTYTTPRLKKDSAETFYAIYSYDGLPTTGFVLSTVYSATTYYLGKYESGYNNRYFNAVTDKAQALVLHNNGGKLYYQSGDTVAYLKANNQSSTYNLLTTNEANATVWSITTEDGKTSIKTTINEQERYLRFNYNSGTNPRYSIYTDRQNPVSEKALSYTTNPVCAQYAYYFVSDAENAEPEYVYELRQDGKVIPYSPKTGCNTKRFIGWSETKVSELQQEAPTIVDVATQTYDRDITLYAVYAAENGGKIVGDAPTTIDNVTAMGAFKTTQDSGMTSLNTRYFYHNAKYWSSNNSMRMTKGKDADSSYITTSLIRNLEKIQVVYANTKPLVYISEDNEEWTEISLTKEKEGTNYFATPETPGDYYVAFSIIRSSAASSSYSDVQAVTYTHNKQYWYSDYSTNCTTAGTATITYAESSETAYQTTSIGEVIALPTPKTEGKHFEGWTINGVNYAGGESYKLSYNVTATATWTDAQLTCTPETLYVVSAKGKTVRSSQTIQISCPEITTGMLEIADVTADEEKTTFHAVITNAEANEETGLNATVAIEFTPNAQNQNRNATMTATIGEEPNKKQVQFHVHGRSLPEKFVIAHQGTDSKWYALPADITAYNTYAGYVIPVVDNKATATTNAIYHLGVDETDHSIVRFLATDTTALMTHATNNTQIKVGKVATDEKNLTQWYLQTSNNSQYVLKNKTKAKNLTFNDNKFGMFASGDTLFQILPVENEVAVITAEVTQWTENGFTFLPSISIPTHDAFSLVVNEETIVGATCTDRYDLYDVNNIGSIGTQQTMQLQWFKDSKPVATATVVSPARVTGNITLSSLLTEGVDAKNLDIVVASGTLTVDEKATIHNLDICAGATVAIVNDTLTTNTLTFRGGLTSTESDYDYEVPRLYIAKDGTTSGYIKPAARVYYYLNVNSNHFYPFTVPYKAAIKNIHYASRPNTEIQSILGSAIKISKYDGEARGQGKATTTKYWSDMSYSNNLIPGVGYIITAKKQKNDTYATLRFLMMVSDIDATTDTVAVGAWGVGPESTTAWYNQGWNYIANPYTAMLAGNNADAEHHAIQSGTDVRYATIPSPIIDGYDQVPMNEAELKPFYGFFIQAGETGNYNFVKDNRHAAPAYLLAEEKPEQEAYINLDGAAMHDQFGLIIGSNYSSDYEINADLTKELGTANDLRAWLMTGETKMAYLAVDDETARTLIPLNLRTPAEGEYTFSIRESSRVEDLEGLYLFDMESGTTTNLIGSDYTFSAPAGAVENRFALNAIRSAHAPTELGEQTDRLRGRGDPPYKRLKDGHIYIIVNGVTYDAEGKEVIK